MPVLRLVPPGPLSVSQTLTPYLRGSGDPTMRMAHGEVWRASRTPDGPATLRIRAQGEAGAIRVEAWGPGAERALHEAPALLGFADTPETFEPREPLLRQLQARFRGLRIGRSGRLMEALVPAILEQKVTGMEARREWRALIRDHGDPAPGPASLRLPPAPDRLAVLPSWAYHPYGIERRRAETVIRACRLADRLERLADVPPAEASAALRAIPGIGAWTAAETVLRALGDPDAVSVGDFHLPHLVSWALAGEPRATDERMLELLASYAGHRARVIRLLEASGIRAPRYGPRLSPRSIAAI